MIELENQSSRKQFVKTIHVELKGVISMDLVLKLMFYLPFAHFTSIRKYLRKWLLIIILFFKDIKVVSAKRSTLVADWLSVPGCKFAMWTNLNNCLDLSKKNTL